MAKSSSKKRKVIVESVGEAHVTASFNNIIISLTNKKGDVISWSSAGKMGFRGSKKNTPYAAQLAAEDCASVAHEAGLRKVKVYVKGPGNVWNLPLELFTMQVLKLQKSLTLLQSLTMVVVHLKEDAYNK